MTTTETAKALVAAVARAFYDDQTIVVVDFLLRNSFLKQVRGMGKRLRLSTKQLSATLQFLKDEHLVYTEEVTGIVATESGGRIYRRKKTADFVYIDLNRAVHSIRLRLHSINEQLLQAEKAAMTATTYKCPNCLEDGIYTELEVQYCPINEEGKFLCKDCTENYPCGAPNSIVLEPVDNSDDLRSARELLSRFKVQMTSKSVVEGVGDRQLRPGIYRLLHLISNETRREGRAVTSNLPSENGAEEFLSSGTYESDGLVEDGLVYFTNPEDGEKVALEIIDVGSTGILAHREAALGSTITEEQVVHAAKRTVTGAVELKSGLKRPQKVLCRQNTPDFLQSNFGARRRADDMDILWRTRELSLETTGSWPSFSIGTSDGLEKLNSSSDAVPGHQRNDENAKSFREQFEAEMKRQAILFPRATNTALANKDAADEKAESFLKQFEAEMKRQANSSARRATHPSSVANKDVSSSSYGSVQWEEG